MVTSAPDEVDACLAAFASTSWKLIVQKIGEASTWLVASRPGDPRADLLVTKVVELAHHSKWEVRRAVAQLGAESRRPEFTPALAKLATDDNASVKKAAVTAIVRRRDWAQQTAFGKQHEAHIGEILADIEARFGIPARRAVRRASERIADVFARELNHEFVKALSPLATSVDRLATNVADDCVTPAYLSDEVAKMKDRVARAQALIDGARAYTAQPQLVFVEHDVVALVNEVAAAVRDSGRMDPPLVVEAAGDVRAELCAGRVAQALTNVLHNAVEAYDGHASREPICVRAVAGEHSVEIVVEDRGCGMSAEVCADATVLFSSSKRAGTGFGLPLVIKIVESEHDGHVNITSTRGAGTIVRLVFPRRRTGVV
ncbi:MAG TPA: HAMP domain-containing sensor histidine kinase [Kofleriaceae bacterium]|jgi:signal transduction histidine kinase